MLADPELLSISHVWVCAMANSQFTFSHMYFGFHDNKIYTWSNRIFQRALFQI